MISIIVAVAENNAIGRNNELLWHLPGDLKRFKKITIGHTVIMGKRTYESLPFRPLKERKNIVLTDVPGEVIPGCIIAYSIQEAISLCNPKEENFIIGGASVYRQFLPYTHRLYLTRVHDSCEGDAFFPELDLSEWKLISKEEPPEEDQTVVRYTYEIYQRST